jgi:hypothetical protein
VQMFAVSGTMSTNFYIVDVSVNMCVCITHPTASSKWSLNEHSLTGLTRQSNFYFLQLLGMHIYGKNSFK